MLVLSWFLYGAFIVYAHVSPMITSFGTMKIAFASGEFHLNFVLIVGTCFLIDILTYSFNNLFMTNYSGKLMGLVKERNGLNNNIDLPEEIKEVLKKYDNYKKVEVKEVKPAVNDDDLDKIDGIYTEQKAGNTNLK